MKHEIFLVCYFEIYLAEQNRRSISLFHFFLVFSVIEIVIIYIFSHFTYPNSAAL